KLMEVVVLMAATGVRRPSGHETNKATKARWVTFFNILKKVNMPVQSIDRIKLKHVQAAIRFMEAKGTKPAYMANVLSAIRRLVTWAGKPNAAPALEDLVLNKANARRSIVAVVPRTLESLGISPERVFARMDLECGVAGLLLRLMHHFGLRP